MGGLCPICGETAPEPSTLCLRRAAGIAEQGVPCDYSQEGEARFADEIGAEKAALVMGALDQPPTELDITQAMIQAGRYAANLNDGTLARIYLAMRTVEWEEAQAGASDQPPASSGKALTGKAQGAWQGIETAEKKSRPSIIVETEITAHGRTDKVEFIAHWAEDLSGEEQPPFRGWFYATGYGFAQLPGTPKRWRPLPAPPASSGQEG